MIKFIFFGRLVKEKGIDLVLDVFSRLHLEGITNWHLDIYGIGPYEKDCADLANDIPEHVVFHGWGEHKKVTARLPEMDFCLMPSLIIETFGLTALESLRAGVPVIGFKKGGTEPFINAPLNIESQPGETYFQKLYHIIKNILIPHKENIPYLPNTNLKVYTPELWLAHFKNIADNAKRILLVSDFVKRVGGVENYIHDVRDLLEAHGYVVELWGTDKKNSFWGLFKTAFNISAWRRLRKKIKEFKPDIVRCHSVVRELGWLPLTAIPLKTRVLMMFHDMGYFVPYPSSLYAVPTDTNKLLFWAHWIHTAKTMNPIKVVLLTLKRWSLLSIRQILRLHDTTYLVPSAFMAPLTEKNRAGRKQRTITLNHFVK